MKFSYLNKTVIYLKFLLQKYSETRMKIHGCIFSEKIVLEKGRVATFSFTTPIRVLTNAVKVFESWGTKKEVENDLLSCSPFIRKLQQVSDAWFVK